MTHERTLEIARRRLPTHHEVTLAGHFTEQAYDQFQQVVVGPIEQDPAGVIVDLDRLKSIVSSGLGLLTALSKLLADSGRRLVLISPRAGVAELIRTVQLDRVMPILPDREAALQALEQRS